MIKNDQLLKAVSVFVFVFFCGIMILAFHFGSNQTFSRDINTFLVGSSIDIQEIKMNIENMDREEIERTIIKIEEEIERLQSGI